MSNIMPSDEDAQENLDVEMPDTNDGAELPVFIPEIKRLDDDRKPVTRVHMDEDGAIEDIVKMDEEDEDKGRTGIYDEGGFMDASIGPTIPSDGRGEAGTIEYRGDNEMVHQRVKEMRVKRQAEQVEALRNAERIKIREAVDTLSEGLVYDVRTYLEATGNLPNDRMVFRLLQRAIEMLSDRERMVEHELAHTSDVE